VDQELRAVPDGSNRVDVIEIPERADFIEASEGEGAEPAGEQFLEYIYHVYLEAFPNAQYFKYQGITDRPGGEVVPVDVGRLIFPSGR